MDDGDQYADATARLIGRRVKLVPISPSDYDALRRVEYSAPLAFRWRHAGAHQSPEVWNATLWDGVLAQFIVTSSVDASPMGLVACYGADHRNGWAYVAAARFAPERTASGFIEGVGLFVDYLFQGWPFRKLYFDSPQFNVSQFRNAVRTLFSEEARLRDHIYLGTKYWDLVTYALYRDQWIQQAHRYRGHSVV